MVYVQKNFNLAWRNSSNNKEQRKIHDKFGDSRVLPHKVKSSSIANLLNTRRSVIIEDSLLLSNFAENKILV